MIQYVPYFSVTFISGVLSLATATSMCSAQDVTSRQESKKSTEVTPKALDPDPRFTAAADYSASMGGRALLVLVDGKTVFERYDNGWRKGQPHPLASGSKSFAGCVAAAMVDDGLLTWDEKVSDTVTQWKEDESKRNITARMLLNLSSGLQPSDDALQGNLGNFLVGGRSKPDELPEADNRFEYALSVGINHTPGSKFEYGPSHFYAFGALVERKLAAKRAIDPRFKDKTYEEYMNRRVLTPANVTIARWAHDRSGNPNLPGGAMMTAQEWAAWGEFIRHRGAATAPSGEHKQIISWDILRECFVPSIANPSYGLTWWLINGTNTESITTTADADTGGQRGRVGSALRQNLRRAVRQELERQTSLSIKDDKGNPLEVYMAAGKGKQRLFIVPELKLTVVRFGKDTKEGNRFSNAELMGPIVQAVRNIPKQP